MLQFIVEQGYLKLPLIRIPSDNQRPNNM